MHTHKTYITHSPTRNIYTRNIYTRNIYTHTIHMHAHKTYITHSPTHTHIENICPALPPLRLLQSACLLWYYMVHTYSSSAVQAVALPLPPPRCRGNWPLFANRTILQNSLWGEYFRAVYGSAPPNGSAYPLCVGDLWMIYDDIVESLNITDIPEVVGHCPKNFSAAGQRYRNPLKYWPSKVSWIWHPPNSANFTDVVSRKPFKNDTWVEVMHHSAPTDEEVGAWFVERFLCLICTIVFCCSKRTSMFSYAKLLLKQVFFRKRLWNMVEFGAFNLF